MGDARRKDVGGRKGIHGKTGLRKEKKQLWKDQKKKKKTIRAQHRSTAQLLVGNSRHKECGNISIQAL